MGRFSVPVRIGNQVTSEFVPIDALVDTGSPYTLLPADIPAQLGIISVGQRDFEIADQRRIRYDLGEARLRLNGTELTVLVVFRP